LSLGYFVLCHKDLAWCFAFIKLIKNEESEVWYFGKLFFGVVKEELDTAFLIELVNK